MRKLLKGITFTGVILVVANIAGLGVVRFGSCGAAAWVVKLVPDSKFGKRVDIARQLMTLHRGSCTPDIHAGVLRFCHDEPASNPGYFEEAVSVDVSIDTKGLEIDSLALTLHPGVTAGVFTYPKVDGSTDPLTYCPAGAPPACPVCGRFAYAPYAEVLDRVTNNLQRVDPIPADANSGRWAAEFHLIHPLSGSSRHILPIHYYALTARSPATGMTCAKRSEATTIDYTAELENLSSEDKAIPLVHANDSVPVTTTVVGWERLMSEPSRARDFGDKRERAKRVILNYKKCLNDHNDRSDLSGYRYWPEDFPDEKATYPASNMEFCSAPACSIEEAIK